MPAYLSCRGVVMTRMDISMNRRSNEAGDHSPPPTPPESHHARHPVPSLAGLRGLAGLQQAIVVYLSVSQKLNWAVQNPRFPAVPAP